MPQKIIFKTRWLHWHQTLKRSRMKQMRLSKVKNWQIFFFFLDEKWLEIEKNKKLLARKKWKFKRFIFKEILIVFFFIELVFKSNLKKQKITFIFLLVLRFSKLAIEIVYYLEIFVNRSFLKLIFFKKQLFFPKIILLLFSTIFYGCKKFIFKVDIIKMHWNCIQRRLN